MAHNANNEDYRRLALRYVTTTNASPAEALSGFTTFWRNAAHNRDALFETDADRAFHLVTRATNIIDYQLPFAQESQVDALLRKGRALLDEALSLDENCFDAQRMLACMDLPSFDERLAYLAKGKDRVKAACFAVADETATTDDERGELARQIALNPYCRWLAAMADHALVCGHNHSCLDYCHELLKLDPNDISDVRFTLALCAAKLEDPDALDAGYAMLSPNFVPHIPEDAWALIARTSLAYKAHRLNDARAYLRKLLTLYPTGANALMRQTELPDGLFARIHVGLFSEDELVLALSEATVLTQEGAEEYGQGPFGMWIVDEVVRSSQGGLTTLLQQIVEKRGGDR